MKERIRTFLWHPLTAVSLLVGTFGQLGFAWFDPLWGLISATSGYWFPAIATTSATILPEIGYDAIGTKLLVGAAVLYVAVQLDRLYEKTRSYLEDR